jgi:hypothetical protein
MIGKANQEVIFDMLCNNEILKEYFAKKTENILSSNKKL